MRKKAQAKENSINEKEQKKQCKKRNYIAFFWFKKIHDIIILNKGISLGYGVSNNDR